jgi:hypothetical protein
VVHFRHVRFWGTWEIPGCTAWTDNDVNVSSLHGSRERIVGTKSDETLCFGECTSGRFTALSIPTVVVVGSLFAFNRSAWRNQRTD